MAQVSTADGWDLVQSITPLAEVDAAERVPGEMARYRVDFSRDMLEQRLVRAGDHLRLTLPVGEQVYDVSRVASFSPHTVSVAGVAADGSGDMVAVTVAPDGAAGVITSGGAVYHVRWQDGNAVLVQVDPAGVDELECAISEGELPSTALDLSPAAMQEAAAPFNMATLGEYGDEVITIDILLAYTENARSWSNTNHGSIEAVIDQMMNLSQLALDNSHTNTLLRIVHTVEVEYDETIDNIPGVSGSSSHLRRFTAGPHYNPWGAAADGFMEEVHDLRDEYGADLASLLADVSGFGGVAWLLGNITGSPHLGFSVNRIRQMTTGYTFVHEVGHNMGNHHSRNQNSAGAGVRGGIFPYSTGWRFDAPNDPNNDSYATVMTYAQAGSPRRPYFSNPDVSYEGVPTGTYSGVYSPADNARSMRETRRVIAAYRPTLVDPPVASVLPDALDLSMEPNEVLTQTLQLSNTGDSSLMWEVDLQPSSASARPAALGAAVEILTLDASEVRMATSDGNHISPSEALRGGDGEIYETDFSSTDGFQIGTHIHESGWTARSDGSPFWVLNSNPSTGSQHLRVGVASGSTSAAWLHSPFFGAWATGAYELSFDFNINETGGPPHFFIIPDGRTGVTTAAVVFRPTGQIQVFNGISSTGSTTFSNTGHSWEPGVYQTVTIWTRPEAAEIEYSLDDEVIASHPILGGATFGQIQITRNSGQTSDYHMDIDNLSLRQLYAGFEWLQLENYSGVTPAGLTSELGLTFDSSTLEPGLYHAHLIVRSNALDEPELVVPIDLAVGAVGTEGGPGELADRLLGNYPNPARGATQISYKLAQAGTVTLELFSVTGQRVALLVDEYGSAGAHEVTLDTGSLASGVYVYRLRTENAVDTGRLVVVR